MAKILSERVLGGAAGALAVAVIAVVVVKMWPVLNPPVDVSVPVNATCDLHRGPCASPLPGGGNVELSITPRPVPVLRPLSLEVKVAGVKADKVEVDFAGADMKMGFNRPQLRAEGDGRFSGEATLPVCVRDRMMWQATVLVRGGGRLYAVPFLLETARNN